MNNDHIIALRYGGDNMYFLVIMQNWYVLTTNVLEATTYGMEDAFETVKQIKAGEWPVYLRGGQYCL